MSYLVTQKVLCCVCRVFLNAMCTADGKTVAQLFEQTGFLLYCRQAKVCVIATNIL
jgi:hypothetical protein